MTMEQFVKKYGTRGLRFMVRRAIEEAEEGKSDQIKYKLFELLEELELAMESVGR